MNDFKKIFESHYTWIEGFMRNVRRYPEKTALIDPLRKLTQNYKLLNAEVNRLSNTLMANDFQPHDIVMVLLKNCPEFVYAYIAAHKMHGVCCPVSFRLSAGELAWAMTDAKPRVFIYDVRFDETVKEALRLSSYQPEHVIVVGGKENADAVTYPEFVAGGKNLRSYAIITPTTRPCASILRGQRVDLRRCHCSLSTRYSLHTM